MTITPGRGGSSSGSTSNGPEFDSHWELGFFRPFPISLNQWCLLKQVHRIGATLLIFNFPTKKESLAVQLEVKQAFYAWNE